MALLLLYIGGLPAAVQAQAAGDYGWTGASSTSWGTAGNWVVYQGGPATPPWAGETAAPSAPTATTNVWIYSVRADNGAAITNTCRVNANGLTCRNLTISNATGTGGTLNGNNRTLYVNGDYTNNGTLSGTGLLYFNGANALATTRIQGTPVSETIGDLQVAVSGKTTTLYRNITVANVLTVSGGQFNTDGLDRTVILTRAGDPLQASAGAIVDRVIFRFAPSAGPIGVAGASAAEFYAFEFAPTATVIFRLNSDFILRKDLRVLANAEVRGVRNAGGNRTHEIRNDIFVDTGGTLRPDDGGASMATFICTGSFDGVGQISGPGTINPLYTVEVADPGKQIVLARDLSATNNVRVRGGTWTDDGANRVLTLTLGTANPLTVDAGSSVTGGTISLEPSSGSGYTLGATIAAAVYNVRLRNTTTTTQTFTLGAALAAGGTLTVDRTSTGAVALACGAYNLTVSGACDIGGAGTGATLSASTATIDFNGTLDAAGNAVTFTGSGRLELAGADTNNLGTFTASTSRVVYNRTAGGQTVYSANYNDIEIDNGGQTATIGFAVTPANLGSSLTITGASILDVTAAFDATGRTVTFSGSGRLELGSTVTSLGASFTASSGTVRYDGSVNQTVAPVNYYDLEISNTGGATATMASASTTNVGNALRLLGAAARLTVSGSFDLGAGASTRTLYFDSSGRLQLEAAVTSLGAFTPGLGTVAYSGSAAQTVLDAAYYDLEIGNTSASGASISFPVDLNRIPNGGTFRVAGAGLADVSSSFDLPTTRSVTFTGSGTLILRASVGGLGTFTAGTGTVSYRNTSAGQTVVAVDYSTLEIDNGGQLATASALSYDAAQPLSIAATLSLVGSSRLRVTGACDATGRTVTFGALGTGRLTLAGAVTSLGALTAGNGTVEFADTSAGQTVPSANYYNLEINNGGQTATASFAVNPTSLGNALTIAGSSVLEVAEGFGFDATGRTVTFTGSGRLELGGTVTSLGTLTPSTGTVRYDSSGVDQSVVVPSGGSYYHLTIANGAARTATASGSFGVSGNLSVSGGAYAVAGTTTTVTGSATVTGKVLIGAGVLVAQGTYDATGGTTEFTGAGTLRLQGAVTSLGTLTAPSGAVEFNNTSAGVTVPGLTYFNLKVNNNGQIATLSTNAIVGGALTVDAGTFRVNGPAILRLDGGATVAGGPPIARWEASSNATIRVAQGTALTINGSFVALGTSSNRVTIERRVGDTLYYAFTINYRTGATFKLFYVDVRNMDENGLRFLDGGITDPAVTDVDIDQTNFASGTTGPAPPPYTVGPGLRSTMINLRFGANGRALSFTYNSFDGSTNFSVTTDPSWAGGLVYMSPNVGGGSASENDRENGVVPDTDPNNTIDWIVVATWVGGGAPSPTSWNQGNNWDTGLPPDPDTDVVIPDVASDPVLDGAGGNCRMLNVTTGTFTINTNVPLNVYGDIINTGTISMTNGKIVLKGNLDVTVEIGASPLYRLEVNKSGGTATASLIQNLSVTDSVTINTSTLSVGNATLTVGGAFTNSSDVSVLNGTLDVDGTFNATGGTLVTGTGRIQLGGSVTSLGTFTAGSGTVAFDGGGAQTIPTSGISYNHVEIGKPGGQTATTSSAAALSVGGNLTLVSGNLTAAAAIAVTGNLWMQATAGTFSAGSYSHTIGGNFTRDGGTLDVSSGPTFTLNGATQSIGGLATTFAGLTIGGTSTTTMNVNVTTGGSATLAVNGTLRIPDGRTLTANGAFNVPGALTFLTGTTAVAVAGGTFDATGGTVTFTTGGTLRLAGPLTSLGAFSAGSGKVVYAATTGAQTILTSGITYYDLEVDKGAQTATGSGAATLAANGAFVLTSGNFTAGAGVSIGGALTLAATAGTFTTASQPISVGGNFMNNKDTASFVAGTGIVTLSGSTQAIGGSASTTFYSLTVGATSITSVNTGPTIAAGGTLTINGELRVPDAITVTVGGGIENLGTLAFLAGTTAVVDVDGSFNSTGSVSFATGGRLRLGGTIVAFSNLTSGSGTVEYDGASDQTIPPRAYYNLEVTKGASTGTLGASTTVSGAVTVNSGTLSAGGYTLDVTGALTVNGTLRPAGGTVIARGTYDAALGATLFTTGRLELRGNPVGLGTFTPGSGTIAYMDTAQDRTVLVPGANYYNLEVANGTRVASAGGALTVTNNVSVVSGTLAMDASGLGVGGGLSVANGATLSASTATITVTGATNANTSGTISFSGAGTLNLDGAVTSLGSFSAGPTSTVAYRSTSAGQSVAAVTYRILRFENYGQVATTSGAFTVNGATTVAMGASAATLALAAGADVSLAGGCAVNGALTLTGACTLRLGAAGLTVTGASASLTAGGSTPMITSTDVVTPTRYPILVTGGGGATVSALTIRYLDAGGLNLATTASAFCDLDGARFEYGSPAGAAVYVQVNVVGSFTFSDCVFEASVPSQPQYNVQTPGGYGGSVELPNSTGGRSGEPFENDTGAGVVSPGTITWSLAKTWTGTTSTDWDVATNWNPNGQPTAADNVKIPDRPNDPILDTTDLNECKTLEITTGTLTFSGAAAVTLSVYGDVKNTGTLTMGTDDAVRMTGSSNQTIQMPAAQSLGDLAIDKSGGGVSLSSNLAVADALTLTAGSLDVGTRTLTITGAVSGAGELKVGTGTIDANGSYATGATTFTGNGRLQLGGSTNPTLGTFTRGTGTVAFDGGTVTAPTSGIEYNHVEVNVGAATVTTSVLGTFRVWGNLSLLGGNLTLGEAMDLDGTLTLGASAGTFTTGAFAHTIGGDLMRSGGTFTATGSLITLDGTTQAVNGTLSTTFAALAVGGTSSTTLSRNVTCGAGLTNNGAIAVADGITLSVAGTLTNGGTLTLASTSTSVVDATGDFAGAGGSVTFTTGGTLQLRGAVTLGTLAAGNGKVEYLGTSPQTVVATPYYDLRLAGSTKTSGGAITVGNSLQVDGSAAFEVNATTVSVSGAATVAGSVNPITSGTLSVTGAFNGAGGNVTFNGTGGRLELGGTVTAPAAFTPANGTVQYKSTAAGQTVFAPAAGYYHLEIAKGAQTATAAASFNVGGNLTVTSGILDAAGTTIGVTGNSTVTGTLRIAAGTVDVGGTYDASGGSTTFTGAGRLDLGGLVADLGTFTAFTGCTVRYDRTAGAVSVDGEAYHHLEIATTGQTASLTGNATAAGNVTIFPSSAFAVGTNTLGVTGNLTRDGVSAFGTLSISTGNVTVGGTYDATSGSTTFTAGGTLQLQGTVTSLGTFTSASGCTVNYAGAGQTVLVPAPSNYHHLRIESSGTNTAGGSLILGGNLNVASGTFALAANDLTVAGTATVAGTVTLSNGTVDVTGTFNATGGTWTFTPAAAAGFLVLRGTVTSLGTFTAANSTVRYQGTADQTVAPVSYYHLTSNPGAGVTVTLSGTATVAGTFKVSAGTFALPGGADLTVGQAGGSNGTGRIEAGTFSMSGASFLRLDGQFNVGSPGAGPTPTFRATGTSPNIPRVTYFDATRYAFSVNDATLGSNGGTVDVGALTFEYCDTDGMRLEPGTTITALNGVAWKNGFAGAGAQTWLNWRLTGGGTWTLSSHDFDGVNFATYNVTSVAAFSGLITMATATGGRNGPTYENDQEAGTVNPGTIDWIASRTWTGNVNINWNNPLNWNPSDNFPQATDEAIIPTRPLSPVLNVTTEVKTLTITTGALTINAANTLRINTNLTVQGAGTLDMTAGTIEFTGGAAQVVNPGASSLYNVTVDKSGGSIQVPAGVSLVVNNALTLAATNTVPLDVNGSFNASGATVTLNAAQELRLGGNVVSLGTLGGTGTVRYDDTVNDRTIAGATYGSLTIAVGAKTATLGGNASVSGVLSVSSGTLDLGTATMTLTGSGPHSVSATLRLVATGGGFPQLLLNDTATLTISGTFYARLSGANRPKVTKNGAGGFSFTLSGTVDIDGLGFSYSGSGLKVADSASPVTNFKNIAFEYSNQAPGSAHLVFERSGIVLQGTGCSFDDANAGGTPYNARTTAGAAGTRLTFARLDSGSRLSAGISAGAVTIPVDDTSRFAAPGGTGMVDSDVFTYTGKSVPSGAGDLTGVAGVDSAHGATAIVSAGAGEPFDSDGDLNENGVIDGGESGAVVEWVFTSGSTSGGTLVGFPSLAWDFNSGFFYSTYATFRDINGANTDDRIAAWDQQGTQKYERLVPNAEGNVVGGLAWWTEGAPVTTARVGYIGTTGGYVYRLEDTGVSFSVPAGWPFRPVLEIDTNPDFGATPINEVTNEVFTDGDNLYLGARVGASYYIFKVEVTTRFTKWAKTLDTALRTRLDGYQSGATKYFYGGTNYLASSLNAFVYRTTDAQGSPVDTYDDLANEPTNDVVARPFMRATSIRVYVGDVAGKVHAMQATAVGFPKVNANWPFNAGANAIRAAATSSFMQEDVIWGDMGGRLCVLDAGAASPAWVFAPLTYDGGSPMEFAGTVDATGFYFYQGNNNGKVLVIRLSDGALMQTWQVAPGGTKVGEIVWDWQNNTFIATPENGQIAYLPSYP